MIVKAEKDPIGNALIDFVNEGDASDIIVQLDVKDEIEGLNPAYFFRDFDEMPKIEKEALKLSKGRILDVGAGAGAHSFYLQEKGMDVTAIDVSGLSCEVMKLSGIKNVVHSSIFEYKPNQKFDTLLLLMNGLGVVQKANNLNEKLPVLMDLLNEGGSLIYDSSDLIYMFDTEDMEKAKSQLKGDDYYGDVEFTLHYEDIEGDTFKWTYLDSSLVKNICIELGYTFEIIKEGNHFDYLARITK